MEIEKRLASYLGIKSQEPNIQLAKELYEQANADQVKQLIAVLQKGKAALKGDAIKVLYELGGLDPHQIEPYSMEFIELLNSKNNRLQWGAMTALAHISSLAPSKVFPHIQVVIEASEKGSVITRDNAVKVLIELSKKEEYFEVSYPLLLEMLLKSPMNQFPMYAEQIEPVVPSRSKEEFRNALESRLSEPIPDSKRKRIDRVLKKL